MDVCTPTLIVMSIRSPILLVRRRLTAVNATVGGVQNTIAGRSTCVIENNVHKGFRDDAVKETMQGSL